MKKFGLLMFVLFAVLIMSVGANHSHASQSTVTGTTYLPDSSIPPDFKPLPSDNDMGTNAEIGPKYPGTNQYMRPGDIIHSPKSFSTFFVGHMGIVGPDLKVRHVHPGGPRIASTLEVYMGLFKPGDKFTVLRARDGRGAKAAQWSIDNINRVTDYGFLPGLLIVNNNYCSKFVWQAYYFGEGYNVGHAATNITDDYILPASILQSPALVTQAVFYR